MTGISIYNKDCLEMHCQDHQLHLQNEFPPGLQCVLRPNQSKHLQSQQTYSTVQVKVSHNFLRIICQMMSLTCKSCLDYNLIDNHFWRICSVICSFQLSFSEDTVSEFKMKLLKTAFVLSFRIKFSRIQMTCCLYCNQTWRLSLILWFFDSLGLSSTASLCYWFIIASSCEWVQLTPRG